MHTHPTRSGALALSLLSLCLPAPLRAQDRPSEDAMFGGSSEQAPQAPASTAQPGSAAPEGAPAAGAPAAAAPGEAAPPTDAQPAAGAGAGVAPAAGTSAAPSAAPAGAATPQTSGGRDQSILGGADTPMFTEEAAPEDPLKIGGQLYLRAQATGLEGQRVDHYAFSTPALLDAYFDARPNDRVRGFALARMTYDPTRPSSVSSVPDIGPMSATGSTAGSASLSSLFATQTRSPRVALDQLWLRFDVAHTVFVTAGKQHVRWGTARFWTPTDYLHLRRRNPLDIFDARTGTTMVKMHVPVESKAWNFYAYGVTEGPDATPTLSKVAGAARAEFVLDTTELGLGGFVRDGINPKLAADLSTGIGDFDFYGELAVLDASDIDRVRYAPGAQLPAPMAMPSWQTPSDALAARFQQIVGALYPVYQQSGYKVQGVVGTNYSHKYNDNDTFTIGAEYFYNQLGYPNPGSYAGLVLPHAQPLDNPAPFFYLGKHYAALYITFPAPFKLDLHTFTLSTLGNLSDRSFITRLDYALALLTHLRFEAFVSARYGKPTGEFRFGFDALDLGGVKFTRAPAILDLGVALRLAI
jgi:hypothetical protein